MLAPLPLVYLGSGVSSGAYLSVASSLVSGHVVGLLVLAALLAGIGYLGYLAQDSYDDVRDAVTEALTRQSVRMAMFQRGLTVGAVLLSGTVLWAFSQSYLVTPIGAVVLGGLVYHGYAGADRATYRLDVFGRDGPARQSVLIQAYALEDADGTEHLVTQVGSDYRLSRDSAAELVAETIDVADGVQRRSRSVPTTTGRQRATDLLEEGLVDADVETELEEQIRTAIVNELRPMKTPVPVADVESALEGYPEDRWQAKLRRLEALGFVSRQDGTLMLERDPWTADTSDPAKRWLGRREVGR